MANVPQKPSLSHLKLKDTPISKMRAAHRKGNDIRIVLDLKQAVSHKSFTLAANEQYSNRLVVDLKAKQLSKSRSVEEVVEQTDREIVIAIDASIAITISRSVCSTTSSTERLLLSCLALRSTTKRLLYCSFAASVNDLWLTACFKSKTIRISLPLRWAARILLIGVSLSFRCDNEGF